MRAYLFGFCHTILHIVKFLLILCINYTKVSFNFSHSNTLFNYIT